MAASRLRGRAWSRLRRIRDRHGLRHLRHRVHQVSEHRVREVPVAASIGRHSDNRSVMSERKRGFRRGYIQASVGVRPDRTSMVADSLEPNLQMPLRCGRLLLPTSPSSTRIRVSQDNIVSRARMCHRWRHRCLCRSSGLCDGGT